MMVVLAEQGQVGEIGWPTAGPFLEVVAVGEEDVVAPRETAVTVPTCDLTSLGGSREVARPALVHRVPLGVVDRDDHVGVTGKAANDVTAHESPTLEFTEQRGRRV